jgi:hypothetical protein
LTDLNLLKRETPLCRLREPEAGSLLGGEALC